MITTADLATITKGADPHVASSSSGSSHREVDTPSSSVKCVGRWKALEDHCEPRWAGTRTRSVCTEKSGYIGVTAAIIAELMPVFSLFKFVTIIMLTCFVNMSKVNSSYNVILEIKLLDAEVAADVILASVDMTTSPYRQ